MCLFSQIHGLLQTGNKKYSKMIVGNVLFATAFTSHFSDNPNVIVFASEVSNSKESQFEQFEREYQLLQEYIRSKKLILYFST